MKKIAFFAIGAMLLSLSVFYYLNRSPSLMRKQFFSVEYGETLRGAAKDLKRDNIIKNQDFFIALAYLLRRKNIKAGRYALFPGMTSLDVLKKLTRGDTVSKKVTIPEGFNLYQISQRIDEEGIADGDRFIYFAFNREFLRSLDIQAPSAEGYLFPDTYVFSEESDARDIISVMHKKLRGVLGPALMQGKGELSLHEILTLASLVEKEAKVPSERGYVSSVFHNRLKKNMKLDCDPTVRYAVKKFTGSITVSDLNSDSPFNTYRRNGLPPTPICSPGRDAIIAAIRPIHSDYLYFVARNDGSHYFSKTLKEHINAVNYYQRGIRNGFVDNQKL